MPESPPTTGFQAAFVISIDLNGETINGLYWPENSGVRVSYRNAAGETRRGWADTSSAPSASQAMSRIVLHELAVEKIEPPTFETMIARLPESARRRMASLRKIVSAMEGVLAVTCWPETNSLSVDVQLAEADRVSEAIISAVNATEGEFVVLRRMLRAASREPKFITL
jgi:hypothetical protein